MSTSMNEQGQYEAQYNEKDNQLSTCWEATRPRYQLMASSIEVLQRVSVEGGGPLGDPKRVIAFHEARLKALVDDLPWGSGIIRGDRPNDAVEWEIDVKNSVHSFEARARSVMYSPNNKPFQQRLVINLQYHHMNDAGYYDGVTSHRVIVHPCLQFDISMTVSGTDKRGIKQFLGEVFQVALTSVPSSHCMGRLAEAAQELHRR